MNNINNINNIETCRYIDAHAREFIIMIVINNINTIFPPDQLEPCMIKNKNIKNIFLFFK